MSGRNQSGSESAACWGPAPLTMQAACPARAHAPDPARLHDQRRALQLPSLGGLRRSEGVGGRCWPGLAAPSLSEVVAARLQVRIFLGGVVAAQDMIAMRESPELTDERTMLFGCLKRAFER
jgi:hypothetical protein